MTDGLWVVQARGTATLESGREPGDRHAMLVFAVARNADDAFDIANNELCRRGWIHVELERSGKVEMESLNSSDEYLVGAADDAMEAGVGVVVYRDPI